MTRKKNEEQPPGSPQVTPQQGIRLLNEQIAKGCASPFFDRQ